MLNTEQVSMQEIMTMIFNTLIRPYQVFMLLLFRISSEARQKLQYIEGHLKVWANTHDSRARKFLSSSTTWKASRKRKRNGIAYKYMIFLASTSRSKIKLDDFWDSRFHPYHKSSQIWIPPKFQPAYWKWKYYKHAYDSWQSRNVSPWEERLVPNNPDEPTEDPWLDWPGLADPTKRLISIQRPKTPKRRR